MSSPPPGKTLAILGATGTQGLSLLTHIFSLPPNSHPYTTIRALTRNPSSPSAQRLLSLSSSSSSSITLELHPANLNDPPSLLKALSGAHAIFAVTDFWSNPNDTSGSLESAQMTSIITVLSSILAEEQTRREKRLEHVIISSLPSLARRSEGKYPRAVHFESKATPLHTLSTSPSHASLWKITTILWLGGYMDLWRKFPMFAPQALSPNEFLLSALYPPQTPLPFISPADIGVGIYSLLSRGPAVVGGKYANLFQGSGVSSEAQVETWGKILGVKARYEFLSVEAQEESLRGMGLGEWLVGDVVDVQMAFGEYGVRVLKGEGVIDAEEYLLPGAKLETWEEYVKREDWTEFLGRK